MSIPVASGRSETVLWNVIGADLWEASIAGKVIGTVVASLKYTRIYGVALTAGGLNGSHSSLENAKAQLEGWARWQLRLPWTP